MLEGFEHKLMFNTCTRSRVAQMALDFLSTPGQFNLDLSVQNAHSRVAGL